MSSFLDLRRPSYALRDILWEAIQPIPTIFNIIQNPQAISFSNPIETHRDQSLKLSLWMYHVTEPPDLMNRPHARTNGQNNKAMREIPLALILRYMATPFALTAEQDLQIMGLVMRVFFDNPIVCINNPADGVFEELRLTAEYLSMEELTRIWDALREPYRLSVCYQVRVTRVDSNRQIAGDCDKQAARGASPHA